MSATPSQPGEDRARIYNGRYELIRQIARGGTAQVYMARDLLLDRPVALKVLFPELSTDVSFVQRFRREAQAAANLSHPDIVPVFDWGESDRTYFIVMEYVDGEPLSAIIRHEAPLAPERAAEIGSHIAKALSYAHRHGVVHRDVKPGNVLITRDGQVKVTDFGIARAVGADDTVTQTGLVMGTATYFSPEQAQGFGVDGRSDVYALGVVLYEMVTGRPPFSADTPVAIAYKHVSEAPVPPREIETAVPVALEAVIMRSMAKHPGDRYATAEDLWADLQRYSQGAPVMALASAGSVAANSFSETQALSTTRAVGGAPTSVMPRGGSGVPPTGGVSTAGSEQADTAGGGPGGELPKRRWAGWAFAGVLLAVLLGFLVYFGGRSLGYFGSGAYLSVPALRGESLSQAKARLLQEGLHVTTRPESSSSVKKGHVIRQSPPARTELRKGDTVTLTYSTGARMVSVPYVLGTNYKTAQQQLSSKGFKVKLSPVAPTIAGESQGVVTKTNPASGQSVPSGTTVTVYYVSGKVRVSIPSVAGKSVTKATQVLAGEGISVSGRTYQLSSTVGRGLVVGTSPPQGKSIPVGQSVSLIVSSGPPYIVPNVVGDTKYAAEQAITKAGLNYSVQYVQAPPSNDGYVIQQSPAANSQRPKGATVTIQVGRAPSSSTTTTTTTSPGTTTTTSPGKSH